MNKINILFLLFAPFLLSQTVDGQQGKSKRDPAICTGIAKEILTLFEKGEFKAIPEKFDQRLKEGLTATKLEASWKDIVAQLGPYKGIQDIRTEMFVGSTIIVCQCQFGEWPIDFKTVYNGAGRVTGLFFLPHKQSAPVVQDSLKKQ
jgi:hypothetical protein